MPVQVEDRLPHAGARVDDDTVIVQPGACCDLCDEVEHLLRLVRLKVADRVEAVDVLLGNDEQMRLRLWVDVADRDEAVRCRDVIAVAVELAEETVLVHAATTPSSRTAAPLTRTKSPTSPSTSHGV